MKSKRNLFLTHLSKTAQLLSGTLSIVKKVNRIAYYILGVVYGANMIRIAIIKAIRKTSCC